MNKLTWLISVGILLMTNQLYSADNKKVEFKFYDHNLSVPVHESMNFEYRFISWDPFFKTYYSTFDTCNWKVSHESLLRIKDSLHLNDWYFYQLIHSFDKAWKRGKKNRDVVMADWFFLLKTGFNARIAYYRRKVTLDIYTTEDVIAFPRQALLEGGYFSDISSHFKHYNYEKLEFYQLLFYPNQGQENFSFRMENISDLKSEKNVVKELKFKYLNEEFIFRAIVDRAYVQVLKNYPETNYKILSEIALSKSLDSSLRYFIEPKIKSMDTLAALNFLLALTRGVGELKDDSKIHKTYNVAYPVERIFASKYIDYEEYAILYKYLCETYLGIKAILVDYPLRAAVAVDYGNSTDRTIEYNGVKWMYIQACDSTNSLAPGEYPKGFEKRSFKIIEY